ncbi:MAG: ABC transporter permease [Chloroflexi bacterium]|nr:ABC transporter permease [Chloroflexota bacterium]
MLTSTRASVSSLQALPRLTLRRRLRWNSLAVLGSAVLLLALVMALFPALFATHDPLALDLPNRLAPPSAQYYLGTDDFGRDIFSRIVYGAGYSLLTAGMVVIAGVVLGSTAGIVAGYVGGWLDELLMRFADVVLAFPPTLLAMVVVTALRPSLTNTVLTLILISWPEYARVMRAQTLVAAQQDYVLAARALGIRTLPLLWRHILPNTLSALIIQATLNLGVTILALAALGFLGLGAQPPEPEWGLMVSNGRNYFLDAWWYPVFPGLAIALVTLGFNIIGDTLRDILDPLSK